MVPGVPSVERGNCVWLLFVNSVIYKMLSLVKNVQDT